MSPELNEEGRAIYMSLVRQSPWLISLGCFDIACAIMTMSRFRAAPCKGHMKRMKRIYGYVKQYQKGYIRVRVDLPDFTDLQHVKYDWTSIFGDISEELPKDMPVPHGKPVITTTYEDAICITTTLPVGRLRAFYIW